MKDLAEIFLLPILLIVIVAISLIKIDEVACHEGWKDSGFPHRWNLFSGCQISLDQGKTWVPSDQYRRVQQ